MSKVLIGADPELFLKLGDNIVSAIGVLPGNKYRPRNTKFGAVQVDNVLAEFNILPAASEDEFVHNIRHTMQAMKLMLPDGMDFAFLASHEYNVDYLLGIDGAFVFGCDPDYNAYTKRKQRVHIKNPALRSAGGHIHIGSEEALAYPERLAIALDYLVALPAVLQDPDTRRRGLYGTAGSFRYKPYGIEYRTPSNFWIKDEKSMRWAYKQAVRANSSVSMVEEWEKLLPLEELQRIINTSDVGAAKLYGGIYG